MRRRIPLTIAIGALIALLAICLSSCGGSPLEKLCKDINENTELSTNVLAVYDEEKDFLEITATEGCNLDVLFETIDENISEQDIGSIRFSTGGMINGYYHYLDSGLMDKYDQKIGDIKCSSINTFGIDSDLMTKSSGNWTKAALLADKVLLPGLWPGSDYTDEAKANMNKFKKVWIASTEVGGVVNFKNLEELALDASVVILPPEDESTVVTEAATTQAANGDISDLLDTDTDETIPQATEESSEEGESLSTTVFPGRFESSSVESYTKIKDAKKLDHIFLSPYYDTYSLDAYGAAFLYALSKVRPDIKVNPPETQFAEDNLVKLEEVDLSAMDQNETLKEDVIKGLLKLDVKDVYKKAIKFDKSSKDPVVKGKALIYIVDASPYDEDWSGDRKFYTSGNVFLSEFDGKIPVPESYGDYETLIYAYPTFSRVGSYTSGTTAYSQTFYVQVFNLTDKKAYGAQKVASKEPPNQFSYYGTAPSKKSGEVDRSKIISFIKKLKTEN